MKFSCKEFNSINEAINIHLNCIFVAIPKTGTTSIRDQLASRGKNFIPNPHLTLNQLRDIIYPYLLRCNLGTNSSYPTTNFHPSEENIVNASKKLFDEMYKFGSVRNPWARVYSLYTREEGLKSKDKMSFARFIDRLSYSSDTCVHPLRTKCQLDWFEDREGNVINTRDNIGVHNDFGYSPTGNFYQIPEYNDNPEGSFSGLLYYQTRWCKHIYAALWSMKHDEGNDRFSFEGRYQQDGPNVSITIVNHGLLANKRVAIDFTSGDLLDGQYIVNSVPDENTIVIVYPFSGTTQGDCTVSNLKIHDYVDTWLLEPIDQPAGNALDKFYQNFDKE